MYRVKKVDTTIPACVRLGCPQWWLPTWGSFLKTESGVTGLSCYSRHFATVEGNTTFYAVPRSTVQNDWLNAVPVDFKFCFKLPKTCTHSSIIEQSDFRAFAKMLEKFNDRVGQVLIQFPASFSWENWHTVNKLVNGLPEVPLAIEVRHRCFFSKGEVEQRLNQWLLERNANRVMFDSRGLFNEVSQSPAILDAKRKKPRLPLHVIATGEYPMVRFIGFSDFERNIALLSQWANKLKEWVLLGKKPYFFLHTADNCLAPVFAKRFQVMLESLNIPIKEYKTIDYLDQFKTESEVQQPSLSFD